LSATPTCVLKRASRSAPQAAKMNAAAQPSLPQAGPYAFSVDSDYT